MIITGGTGTIGRNVTKLAVEKLDDHVEVWSRDASDQRLLWEELGRPTGLTFTTLNIKDIESKRDLPPHANEASSRGHINLAAMKHVPDCEEQPLEAVRQNVYGAYNMVEVPASPHVFISSDKAVQPQTVYGYTKALAERLTLQRGGRVVRLPNIKGSSGSFLPLAEAQAKNGEVYLTDPEMKRMFMDVEDAARFIMQVYVSGTTGQVHVPEAPEQERIKPYLEEIADRHGAELKVVGKRSREKIQERLAWPGENVKVFSKAYIQEK